MGQRDQNTVIVLGAGSSCPYGLPSGSELRDFLIDSAPQMLGQDGVHLRFSTAFQKSMACSVDYFIENNPSLADYGRFSIAFHIHRKELRALEEMRIASDWMLEFLKYCPSMSSFLDGRYKFITFNYDRLWEAAILCAFRDRSGHSALEHWEACCRENVVHVYGRLEYDIAALVEKRVAPAIVNGVVDQDRLVSMATGLRLVESRQGDSHSEIRTKCAEWLRDATEVVFLGFAFDRINLARMGWFDAFVDPVRDENELIRASPVRRQTKCGVYATTFGVETAELIRIRRSIGKDVHIGGPFADCVKFLRGHCVDWLFD